MVEYVAKVTSKGQLTIPKAMRERYGIEEGDFLIFDPREDDLLVRKGQMASSERPAHEDFESLADRIADHFEEHGITRADVEDAIRSARSTTNAEIPDHVEEDAVVSQTTLEPRTRVRLRDNPFGVQLRSMSGCIERLELSSGYYIVQLDEPAIYFHADGTTEDLTAIREAGDNLIVERMEQ